MALSGTIVQDAAESYPNWKLRVEWTAVQDVDSHASSVTVVLSVYNGVSASSSSNASWYKIQNMSSSISYNWTSANTWHRVGTHTFVVNHDDNGNAVFTLNCSWYSGNSIQSGVPATISISSDIQLDTISDSSVLRLLVTGNNILGKQMSMFFDGVSENKYYGVTANIGQNSYTILSPQSGVSSCVWVPPLSLAQQYSVAGSVRCTLTLTQYSNQGTADNPSFFEELFSTTQIMIAVPIAESYVNPEIGTQDITDNIYSNPNVYRISIDGVSANNSAIADGEFQDSTLFIRGITRVVIRVKINWSSAGNLTFLVDVGGTKQYFMVHTGSSSETEYGTFTMDRAIAQSGVIHITVSLQDGSHKSETDIVAQNYTAPKIVPNIGESDVVCKRCNATSDAQYPSTADSPVFNESGSSIYLSFGTWYASLPNNSVTVWYQYKQSHQDDSFYSMPSYLTLDSNGNYKGILDASLGDSGEYTYTLRLGISDQMMLEDDTPSTTYKVVTVNSKLTSFHLGYGGNSVGLGMKAHGDKNHPDSWSEKRMDVADGYHVYLHGNNAEDETSLQGRLHNLEVQVFHNESDSLINRISALEAVVFPNN